MDNGRQPATRQDLADLEKRLTDSFTAKFATKQDLAELEKRLTDGFTAKLATDLADLEQRLREAIHDSETKLLTAFYAFAESNQRHLTDLGRGEQSMRDRFAALEMRLLDIEKRLNMPPPRQ